MFKDLEVVVQNTLDSLEEKIRVAIEIEIAKNRLFKEINIIKDDKNSIEFLDDIKVKFENNEFKLASTKKTINLLKASDIGRANPKLGEIQPTAWQDKLTDTIEKKAFNL